MGFVGKISDGLFPLLLLSLLFSASLSTTDIPDPSEGTIFPTAPLSCHGEYSQLSGSIASPNYHQDYPNDVHCRYSIIAPEGYVIVLKFTDLDIEYYKTCPFDRLRISNHDDDICGDQRPSDPIISPGNVMTLEFLSDGAYTARGFRVEYGVQPKPSDKDTSCDREYNSPTGVLISPNYPYNYPNNARCTYRITAPEDHIVVLTVTDLYIEYYNACGFDRLQISNDTNLCGYRVPSEPFVSPDNEVTVQFHSDGSNIERGFRIEYTTQLRGDKLRP